MTLARLTALAACLAALGLPGPSRAQSRDVAFTVTEGTWISLDVTPDGRTLVFDLLGELYALPTSGGSARRIIAGRAFESQPRVSPDGARLAWVSDADGTDNIWIAAIDGRTPRQLTRLRDALVISPAWSPDGAWVYATVVLNRAAELWRFDAASGEGGRVVANTNGPPSLLVSTPAPGPYGAAPSPDGQWLYYASVTPSAARTYVRAQSRIIRRHVASGQEAVVVTDISPAMRPVVSPDGSWLVYGAQSRGQTGLRRRALATGEERWLVYPLQRNELEARASRDVLPGYAFTPDSRHLVVAFGGRIVRVGVADGRQEPIPFEAAVSLAIEPTQRAPRRLTDSTVLARMVQHPAAGPAGQVAYSALARIWIAGPGRSPRRLTSAPAPREYMPAWSPDGRWIAFVSWGPAGGSVWKAPADGGGSPTQVSSQPGVWMDPVWTPAGDSLVVLRGAEGASRASYGLPSDAEIVMVPASGGRGRVVGPAGGARRLHFSGGRLMAQAGASLVEISLGDGTRTPRLSWGRPGGPPPLFGPSPVELRGSPGGQEFMAMAGERVHRLPMPAPGASAPSIEPPVTAGIGARDALAAGWAPDGSLGWLAGRTWVTPGDTVSLEVRLPRPIPAGRVLLRGARLVTMRGNEVIPRGDLLVHGERIEAIGATGRLRVPAGTRVIDVSGRTIVPGFIDVHAHVGQRHEFPDTEHAAMLANLAFGVTTLRDPQTPPDIFALADLTAADGLPAPRVFSTGPGVFSDRNFQSLDETRAWLRRYRDVYGTNQLKSYLVGTRQQRQWVMQASRELGLMPTTEGGADTRMDLTHAIDGFSGNEHSVPTTPIYRDIVELVARSGIAYTPTLLVTFGGALPIYRIHPIERSHLDPRLQRFWPPEELYRQSASPRLGFPDEDYNDREAALGATAILRAGGLVALGGHGEMQGLQAHWEMQLLAEGGMTPHEVLRVATLNGAKALGMDADLGSLEVGKLADLVVLDRNPLSEVRHTRATRFVMRGGVLYDAATLDEVWPKPRPLPAPWWRGR